MYKITDQLEQTAAYNHPDRHCRDYHLSHFSSGNPEPATNSSLERTGQRGLGLRSNIVAIHHRTQPFGLKKFGSNIYSKEKANLCGE